jgi:hypothetical protein
MDLYVGLYGNAFKKSIRKFYDRQDMIMAQVPNLTTLAYINDPFSMGPGYFFDDTLYTLMENFKQLQETSIECSRPEIFEDYTTHTELLSMLRTKVSQVTRGSCFPGTKMFDVTMRVGCRYHMDTLVIEVW